MVAVLTHVRYIIKPLTIIIELPRESVPAVVAVSALVEGIVSSLVVGVVTALVVSPLVVSSLVEVATLPSELPSLPAASHDLQTDSASRLLIAEASNFN